MTVKNILVKSVIISAASILFSVQTALSAINVNGSIEARNQTGVHEGDVYQNLLKADLELGQNLDSTVVKVVLRAEENTIRPEDNGSNYLRDDSTGSQRVYLREAYISRDINFESVIDSVNLKLGRIIYTWGNADEQKPVDILNPQDYSNLYFTSMQERKFGVLSGSMSVYLTDNVFIEGVIIPEFRPSEIASSVFVTAELSEFATNPAYSVQNQIMPENKIGKSSYAGRFGLTVLDIDMHANYFCGYDTLPVYEMRYGAPITITPEYKRVQMYGFDFQRALFLGMTIRGEGSYYNSGKFFYYKKSYLPYNLGVEGGSGSVEKKYVQYTAGFDDHDFLFDDLYLNMQFNQKIIIGYDDNLAQQRNVNHILWTLKYFIDNKKFCISTKGAYNIKDKSCYANAELMVKMTDSFELMAGGWILEGGEDTDIGQFDLYDMVYVAGRVTF